MSVPKLPDELNLSKRRAEAVLQQLIKHCSPLFADFHHGRNGGDVRPYDPVCSACPHGLHETIEHMILRCPGRAVSRRKVIGRIGNKSVEELCREKPIEVLRFLDNEELLESNSRR